MALARACDSLHANTVTELNLPCSHLGDEGACALADALQQNNSLVNLIIYVRLAQLSHGEGIGAN